MSQPASSRKNGPRYQAKLARILRHATAVFYTKGYEGASIRDISRASGISLAGLYHYFRSKPELLYLIQKHTFNTILVSLEEQTASVTDPEQKLRLLIHNHLRYFLEHEKEMKVLSHESDVLTGAYAREVGGIKKRYYKICLGIVEELEASGRLRWLNARIAVLSLFGMMNWIYTWYNPRVDPDVEALAETMGELFVRGLLLPGQPTGSDSTAVADRPKEVVLSP